MNLRNLTSTRGRRLGMLIVIIAAALAAPLGPTWLSCILGAFVAGLLAKAVLTAMVMAESNLRAIRSAESVIAKSTARLYAIADELTSLTAQVETGLGALTAGQTSAEADITALTSRVSDTEVAHSRLAELVESLSRTQQEVAQTVESWPSRLERLENLTSQSTSQTAGHRRENIGLGGGLEGPPEARLAAAIAGLRNSLAG